MLDVFLYYTPPLYFETGSFTEFRACQFSLDWLSRKPDILSDTGSLVLGLEAHTVHPASFCFAYSPAIAFFVNLNVGTKTLVSVLM